jgi:copper chaperone CopZ
VSVAVRKLEGVESVDVSLEKAAADIRLRPNNHLTLAQLRAAIKKNGYATRDAQVEARGKIVSVDGKPTLDLLNGETLPLAGETAGKAGDRVVDVTGVAHIDGKGPDTLTVGTIR